MICFYIKNNVVFREEWMVAVCVLTSFCNKYIAVANMNIASNSIQDTAYRNSRVVCSLKENLANHWCGCCLAVSSCNGNWTSIVLHNLTKELSSCKHWLARSFCSSELRVILTDCSSINNQINIICNIRSCLRVINLSTKCL